jgi:hypothetical protein
MLDERAITMINITMLPEEKKMILSQALWDLNLTPEEFEGIIKGAVVRSWPDRGFCVARLLESVNWYDVVKIFSLAEICAVWEEARKHLRSESIRKGMDFACGILR